MSDIISNLPISNTTMATTTDVIGTIGNNAQNRRLEKTTVCLPIVRGSIAYYIGAINKTKTKTSSGSGSGSGGIGNNSGGGIASNNDSSNTATTTNDFHTHQWTLYVRGPNNEDLSSCISKVIFQLHPSFAQPIREVYQPPYEVTEKGWGEFEAQIRIVWNTASDNNNMAGNDNNETIIETMNPNEQSIILNHFIRLYPQKQQQQPSIHTNTTSSARGVVGGGVGGSQNQDTSSNNLPVVSESYDEVVFTDPTESFFRKLQAVSTAPTIGQLYTQHQHFASYSDTEVFHTLLAAQEFLQNELALAKQRFVTAQTDLQAVDEAYEFIHGAFASSAANEAAAAAAAAASAKSSTLPSTMMSPLLTTKTATSTFPPTGAKKIPSTGTASAVPSSLSTVTVPKANTGKTGPTNSSSSIGTGQIPIHSGSGPVAIASIGTKQTSSNKKKKGTLPSSSTAAGGSGGSKKKAKKATDSTSTNHPSSSYQPQPPPTNPNTTTGGVYGGGGPTPAASASVAASFPGLPAPTSKK